MILSCVSFPELQSPVIQSNSRYCCGGILCFVNVTKVYNQFTLRKIIPDNPGGPDAISMVFMRKESGSESGTCNSGRMVREIQR